MFDVHLVSDAIQPSHPLLPLLLPSIVTTLYIISPWLLYVYFNHPQPLATTYLLCSQYLWICFFVLFTWCFFSSTPHGLQDFSFLTRDQSWALSSESAESLPLDCQGIPFISLLFIKKKKMFIWLLLVSAVACRIFLGSRESFLVVHKLSSCGAWAQYLWHMGLVAPRQVGS